MAQKFGLVEVAEQDKQDKKDLEQLAANSKVGTYKTWRDRMQWESGHEKMITFGAALEVKGATKGVYCYSQDITATQATFSGVSMTWEKWIEPLKENLDNYRKWIMSIRNKYEQEKAIKNICENNMMCIYYQKVYEEKRLTLPKTELDNIKLWVNQYLKGSNAKFPYSGEIPNGDLTFTIDFEKDIEIVKTQDLKNNMAEYNAEHNTEHNKDMGRNKVGDTFSRLTGNEWSRAEILKQGFNKGNLDRFIKYKLIERTGRGRYKRKS